MKKRIIALSVAAAMGGFAATASAQQAESLVFNPAGVGHILLVPYFSTQSSNVTLLNVTNTDTVYGKVLKVRFRGASNSDDVLDFQVFLSPGDMWTAEIAISGAGGVSQLRTSDNSCTLPANVRTTPQNFIITRTASQATDRNAETREGYIEILNMGDIIDDGANWTALYNATKHVDGVAPCTSSVLNALTNENAWQYMTYPTTGLMANWTIINVQRILAYSGEAAAIEARASDGVTPGYGRLVYWDQRSTLLSQAAAENNTADPLLRGATPLVAGARYDLPDLSTPYIWTIAPSTSAPFVQAANLSGSIATTAAAGEFFNLASVGAATDWVVSFPTRRYHAAVRYTGTGAPAAVYNTNATNVYFTSANTEMGSPAGNGGRTYQLCARLGTNAVGFYNREEVPTIIDDIVISPGVPTSLSLCGEVSVVGVNGTTVDASSTFASIARANINNGFTEGWGFISSPNGGFGLPYLGRQFTRISNTQTNVFYGVSYGMRTLSFGLLP